MTSALQALDRRPPRRGAGAATTALGPAFVAAVAYVDPGNIATNTTAGSTYGFALLWVVVLATAMAGPVQYLSAKLGLVTGRSLPQVVAARTSRRARLAYWGQAELVAMATDVAEVVGAAVGLNLLLGVPLVAGGAAAGAVGMVLLLVRDRRGARTFERVCAVSLVLVGGGFAVGIVRMPPDLADLSAGLVPNLHGGDMVLLAAGIVGATVMPHAVYLHSALTAGAAATATRDSADHPTDLAVRLRSTRLDVGLAMLVAGSVNVSMLVLGATALGGAGEGLQGAARTLSERLGAGAGTAFAVALLVSGLASTAVGTHAGSVIMGGLLRRRTSLSARRLVALVPALALLGSGAEPLQVLVLSQVVLALGLPFALVPLLRATGDRRLMGAGCNARGTAAVAGAITAVIVALDLALVALTVQAIW